MEVCGLLDVLRAPNLLDSEVTSMIPVICDTRDPGILRVMLLHGWDPDRGQFRGAVDRAKMIEDLVPRVPPPGQGGRPIPQLAACPLLESEDEPEDEPEDDRLSDLLDVLQAPDLVDSDVSSLIPVVCDMRDPAILKIMLLHGWDPGSGQFRGAVDRARMLEDLSPEVEEEADVRQPGMPMDVRLPARPRVLRRPTPQPEDE